VNLPTIYPVACHTDHVGPGSIFVAIQGFKQDGVRYIQQALEKGATEIVVQDDAELSDLPLGVHAHKVSDTRKALAELSAQAAGYPAKKLKIIGVTGTKGKTTTVYLIEQVLKTAGYKTARLSTVNNAILDRENKAQLTTPQPDYLHQFFKRCVQEDVEYVVMEVAAQALSLHRVHGLQFDGVIFTNFSQEHGEFYDSMEDYFAAKCTIFEQINPGSPVLVNADDAWCRKINHYVSWFSLQGAIVFSCPCRLANPAVCHWC